MHANGSGWAMFLGLFLFLGNSRLEAHYGDLAIVQDGRSIAVVEPDGDRPSHLKGVVGNRNGRFTLDDQLNVNELKMARVLGVADGRLPMDFQPDDDFVALWTTSGFIKLPISRLKPDMTIRLQSWSSVQVVTENNKELIPVTTVEFLSSLATDGRYQGLAIYRKAAVPNQSPLVFERIPPGENRVSMHGVSVPRVPSKYIYLPSGESFALGTKKGRRVRGRIVFPANMLQIKTTDIRGSINSLGTSDFENWDIKLTDDGQFEADGFTPGQYQLTIQTVRTRDGRSMRASLNFECDDTSVDDIELGVIALEYVAKPSKEDAVLEVYGRNDKASPTSAPIAHIGLIKQSDGKFCYQSFVRFGVPLRSFDELYAPSFWATGANLAAIDSSNNRIHLVSVIDSDSRECIFTFDRLGRELLKMPLQSRTSHRIEVDSSTGKLWILAIGGKSTQIHVLDLEGSVEKTFESDAFTLCYSEADQAMWAFGMKGIRKLDTKDGDTIMSYPIPRGGWCFTQAQVLEEGGLLVVEQLHPDLPWSANRIWKFDSDCNPIAQHDTDDLRINSFGIHRREVWVTGTVNTRLWTRGPDQTKSRVLNSELVPIQGRTVDYSFVANSPNGKGLYGILNGGLHPVQDGDLSTNSQKNTLQNLMFLWPGN
jgi:hypothetical protein